MPTTNLRLLVAHDPVIPGEWVTEHLPQSNGVVVKACLASLSPDSEPLRSVDVDMLIVACGDGSDAALHLVQWWASHRPGRPVIVLCETSPNGFIQHAFKVGADDLVVIGPGPDVSPDSVRNLSFALQKAMVRRRPSTDRDTSHGTSICVLGPKGGVGKTVTCCNLAVALAMRRKKIALIDLDLQFGDVSLMLGLKPEVTIYDLIVSGGSLDVEKMGAFLTAHPSGLHVLAAPVRPDQADIVKPEFAADVLGTLRTAYDYVVIDTPPSFTPAVISAIDSASYVCLVGMLDAVSLKNTRLGLETLALMGYPSERVRIALNRANTSVGITGHDVATILGRPPDVLIPSSRDLTRSVNEGQPIVMSHKRSDTARSFNALGELLAPPSKASPATRRKRMSLRRSQD